MKDSPDYVIQDGFISQEGSSGTPDWLFVHRKDTVWIGYGSFDDKNGYYCLRRYSGEKTLMSIETADFED